MWGRRHTFHYRYDTAAEIRLPNAHYAVVRVRLNVFTATTKAVGWVSNKHRKKTRIYEKPRTPDQRVIDSGSLPSQSRCARPTDGNHKPGRPHPQYHRHSDPTDRPRRRENTGPGSIINASRNR
jgi:hypothetical protein